MIEERREGPEDRRDEGAAARLVDSTLWKLLSPLAMGLIGFYMQQVMTRLDRLEASNMVMQTAQAVQASVVTELKEARLKRDIEMAAVHSEQAALASRMAALEATAARK